MAKFLSSKRASILEEKRIKISCGYAHLHIMSFITTKLLSGFRGVALTKTLYPPQLVAWGIITSSPLNLCKNQYLYPRIIFRNETTTFFFFVDRYDMGPQHRVVDSISYLTKLHVNVGKRRLIFLRITFVNYPQSKQSEDMCVTGAYR